MNFKTFSPKQTKKIAASLFKKNVQLRRIKKTALAIALSGELGSGKTTFVQGFLRAAGVKSKITSPTFVLMKKFQIPKSKFQNVYHIDCYRIQKSKELINLGLKEILNEPRSIILIEWAEKIRRILPKNAVLIRFKHGKKENERNINLYSRNDL